MTQITSAALQWKMGESQNQSTDLPREKGALQSPFTLTQITNTWLQSKKEELQSRMEVMQN
ncbi:MAG: hypothetical protein WCS69_02740 [Ignavibacteriaceae bacterium]